jgi:hypothetical protein
VSCSRYERTLELASRVALAPHDRKVLDEHARHCDRCRDALATLEILRGAREAFAVPEPHPSYWVRFGERLEARLRRGSFGGLRAFDRIGLGSRLGLALGTAALFIVALLLVRRGPSGEAHGPVMEAPSAARATLREEELLGRLRAAPREELNRALEEVLVADAVESGVLPVGQSVEVEEPRGGESTLADEVPMWTGTSSDETYWLFQELDAGERARVLKEIHDELG